MTTARDRSEDRSEESVVDPSQPKTEQEKRVEDEIEQGSAELYRPSSGKSGDSAAGRAPSAQRSS